MLNSIKRKYSEEFMRQRYQTGRINTYLKKTQNTMEDKVRRRGKKRIRIKTAKIRIKESWDQLLTYMAGEKDITLNCIECIKNHCRHDT